MGPSTFIGELESEYTLTFAGKVLEDDETIEELGLTEGSTIEDTVPLLGGGNKRNKVKMATLKHYKVDDTGKIERKRKECPADICGPGIFMSNHKDRQYCGKCALTIKF